MQKRHVQIGFGMGILALVFLTRPNQEDVWQFATIAILSAGLAMGFVGGVPKLLTETLEALSAIFAAAVLFSLLPFGWALGITLVIGLPTLALWIIGGTVEKEMRNSHSG